MSASAAAAAAASRRLLPSASSSSAVKGRVVLVSSASKHQHQHHHQHRQSRSMVSGTRGARGHGWLIKYREGRGGRHLQGRWHGRDLEALRRTNDEVFALNGSVPIGDGEERAPTVAFLDVSVGGTEARRVTVELASAALPVTCLNFARLCGGGAVLKPNDDDDDGGEGDAADRTWGYRGTVVDRIEKTVGLCMGDVLGLGGRGGRCHPSLWSPGTTNHPYSSPYTFADEPKVLSHVGPGVLTMLSPGVHENDSRFLITTADAPQLDGRFVAFGRVRDGMEAVEDILANVFTKKGRPTVEVAVVGCGVVEE